MVSKILRSMLLIAVLTGFALAALLHYQVGWPWLLAVPAGLILPNTAHALLLGIEFALTAWLGRSARLPDEATQYDLGGLLKAWLTEIPVAFRVFCINMPWLGHRALRGAVNGQKIPVVLVHGYFCNQALFRPMAAHLARQGHPVETMNLEPVFGSIDNYAGLIHEAVQRARQRSDNPDGKVALVGHSMGGLAIRAYLRQHDDPRLGPIMTLGSPHRGTDLAWLGSTTIVRQMRPGNDWLNELAASEPLSRTRRFTVILSEHDNIVTPQRSQWLPGSQVVAFSGLGHVDLACHPAVWSIIDDCLDQAQRPQSFNPGAFAAA